MPINVFGNYSNNSDNKIDTSLFVQKPYLRTIYIEANIEEHIDSKNQYKIKILPEPISIREAVSKIYVDHAIILGVNESLLLRLHSDSITKLDERGYILLDSTVTSPRTTLEILTKNYVDNKFNDPSINRITALVDFNDQNIDYARFVKVNSMPSVRAHLTPKYYVDNAISYWLEELSLLRLDPNEELNLDEQDSIILNSNLISPKTIIEIPTKNYVDSLHESSRNRRDLSSIFNDQDNEIDINKLTNLDSVSVNRNPNSDKEVVKKSSR